MSSRRTAALAGSLILVSATAHAVVPRGTGPRPAAEHLTAMPASGVTKPLRTTADLRWAPVPSAAWTAFRTAAGGRWSAAFDRATGVPSRIWGSGIAAPNSVASPAIAEAVARQWLMDHVALLAPGSAATDFELVANNLANGIRSIGFIQRANGKRVVGGQVSFRFKRDRLIAIGSEALPDVAVASPRTRLARAVLKTRATTALRADLLLPNAPVTEPSDEVILPLVGDDAVLGYRLARVVTIDGGVDGRYLAYVDVTSGAVLAVHQQNAYASGTVLYRAVDRHPGKARVDRPATRAFVVVAGTSVTTSMQGGVTWSPDSPQPLTTGVVGDLVKVVNKLASDAPSVIAELMVAPNQQTIWDATVLATDDAQVNAFVAANAVKDFVRLHIDPNLPKLGEQLVVNVNIGNECNAFFDGKTINFFQSSMMCQNTALLEDVVYHEFGHALHSLSVIMGVGMFDGAMSEGASDFLAASMTGDAGMGRGFFYSDTPLRDLDPDQMEWQWPQDVKEIHHTGMIYGGALWDLRKDLIAQYGEAEGTRIVQELYVGTLRRATNIPTALVEALVENDDDGNLDNGTPQECAIRKAFGKHGLRTATGNIVAPGTLDANALSTLVKIDVTGLSARCTSDAVESVTVDWKPSGSAQPSSGSAEAHEVTTGAFWVQLPLATNGKVLYRAKVKFEDTSTLTLADNLADPYYELYQGPTVPLYCTDFESGDPFAEGWTTGTMANGEDTSAEVPSPWMAGPAMGGPTDPPVAYSGTKFMAQGLGIDYEPGMGSWVKMPPIDVGRWTDVHLQYRRWLATEDSHFDKARVTVNDKQAWLNFTANLGDASNMHHVDREWRFHDVLLSGWSPSTTFTVGWSIDADMGLHLGGWHIDDVCVVANINSVCGDGVKTPTEGCDEGANNSDVPNSACRTYCLRPACGDKIVDTNEECDHGQAGDNTCTSQCQRIELPTLGGCCSASGGSGSIALGAIVGGLILRRRRRR